MNTLVISDLDGTLLNTQGQLSDFTVEAVNSVIRRGVHFTYATARSLNSSLALTNRLHLTLPVITYNGACIKRPSTGEIVDIQRLDETQIETAAEVLRRFGVSPLVYTFLDGEEKVLWVRGAESEGMLHYLNSRNGDGRMLPVDSFDDLFCGEIFYITCIEDARETLEPVRDNLRSDSFTCILQQEIYRPEFWLEIMDVRVSKAHALDTLKLLTDMDRVVAFGDSINDAPLFEAADECYAVRNAVEALKRVADDVIESNDEDGVARWLLENCNRLL